MEQEKQLIYVYGLTETADFNPPATGMGEGIIFLPFAHGFAIAEFVEVKEFGETALQQNLDNLKWLALKAVAHEQAVNAIAAKTDILPFKFATLFLSESTLAKQLDTFKEQIATLFKKLRGRQEWTFKVWLDEPLYADSLAQSESQQPTKASAVSGTSYLLKKKKALHHQNKKSELLRGEVNRLLTEFSGYAQEIQAIKPTQSGLQTKLRLVYQCAVLTDKSAADQFLQKSDSLSDQLSMRGIHIEVSGPFAPFHFSDLQNLS